jgi:adenylylsulfate kinase-like enzyme
MGIKREDHPLTKKEIIIPITGVTMQGATEIANYLYDKLKEMGYLVSIPVVRIQEGDKYGSK